MPGFRFAPSPTVLLCYPQKNTNQLKFFVDGSVLLSQKNQGHGP